MDYPVLQKIIKALRKSYSVQEFMDNALTVSFKDDEQFFALVIIEDEDPEVINYSVAVNAPDPFSIADVALRLMHISKTILAEPFFVDDDGEILWGRDAYDKVSELLSPADANDLMQMDSPSKLPN